MLLSWDGRWYLEIVRNGYPHSIPPNITYEQSEARAAFFPVYPMLVRFVDAIAPGGDTIAALFVNFVLAIVGNAADRPPGAASHRRRRGRGAGDDALRRLPGIVRAVVRLRRGGPDRAVRRHACCCSSTSAGCWQVSSAHSQRRRARTASRSSPRVPWRRSSPSASDATGRSLAAPLLSPIGFVAFQVFLRHHTDESWPWFRVQREAWREGTSFGATAIRNTISFLGTRSPARRTCSPWRRCSP